MTPSTTKAVEDAKRAQASTLRECADAGHDPPPYVLQELIGKGSFGRVYKATATSKENEEDAPPAQVVSVKIISIEEGDGYQPGAADTFSDILKEVNTLKLLRSTGAKNINHIIDTLLVGQSVWMVTEYCAGGSVASLMRPTGGGLPEQWIIPILREVAEAISWIHPQGIIHRDIKCANVLITENGAVQLCDFGVAGIVASKLDKRTTVTGTLQWMAPELFDSSVSYGIEVDIWAFGAMAFEIASGLPPNATTAIDTISQFGSYLKANCPRLEGDQYSPGLRDLVSFCMVDDPAQRPPIDQVQKHPYLFDTAHEYPTSSLWGLVAQYRLWEAQGGSRQSLFTPGGAQGPANSSPPSSVLDDDWTFGTNHGLSDVADGEQRPGEPTYQVSSTEDELETQRPIPHTPRQGRRRRRRRPTQIRELKVPLQKVFDPGTMSKYEDNVRHFYGRHAPPPTSDSNVGDDTQRPNARESLIDLDASSADGREVANFANDETVKPRRRSEDLSRRRTQDWTFPLLAPAPASASASADTGALQTRWAADDQVEPHNRSSAISLIDLDAAIDGGGGMGDPANGGTVRPRRRSDESIALDRRRTQDWAFPLHAPPAPPATATASHEEREDNEIGSHSRSSAISLIDLDESLVDVLRHQQSHSSTGTMIHPGPDPFSDAVLAHTVSVSNSASVDWETASAPFSLTTPEVAHGFLASTDETPGPGRVSGEREPSLYVPDDIEYFNVDTAKESASVDDGWRETPERMTGHHARPLRLPPAPPMPAESVMQGTATEEEVKAELRRIVLSFGDHLQACNDVLRAL